MWDLHRNLVAHVHQKETQAQWLLGLLFLHQTLPALVAQLHKLHQQGGKADTDPAFFEL